MSDLIYPTFPGLKPTVRVQPEWKSDVIEAWSGAETVLGRRQFPRYVISLGYEVLRSSPALAERRQLLAFFNFHRGAGESFLYVDEEDNAVTDEQFGTTDGTTRNWQLTRSMSCGSAVYQEPVWAPQGALVIKRGVSTLVAGSDYTLGANGLIVLAAPGGQGQALTWTGSYALRVRFKEDSLSFERFLQGLWSTGSIELISKVYP